MKLSRLLLLLATLVTLSSLSMAYGQTGTCGFGTYPQCLDSQTTSTSATVLTVPSNGGLVPTFEYLITGTPATISVVIQGCSKGGTCTTLNTYTTVANTQITPTLTATFDHFTVTPTWTGGTAPTFTVNTNITTAYNPNAAGAPPTGSAGGDLSGTYPNPTVQKLKSIALPTLAATTGIFYDNNGIIVIDAALPAAAEPAHTGDMTNSAGSLATTVGALENIALPTLAAQTGLFYDTNGVLSLQATLPSAAIPSAIPIGDVGSAGLSGTTPITIASTGVIACPTCIVAAVNPTVGLLRVAGSTQTATGAELSGDVTTNGSNATTLVKIGGIAVGTAIPRAFGNGFVVWCGTTSSNTFACLGDQLSNATSATVSGASASSTQPVILRSTSAAVAGDEAGWSSSNASYNPYYANRQPVLTTGIAYSASTDYTQQGRVQIGFVGSACTLATITASDTSACTYAIIRYSAVASDSHYKCVTDNGSGSPTVTDIGVSPTTAFTFPFIVSINASNVTCTVGSTTVTNSSTLPSTSTVMYDLIYNTTETASTATHIQSNGLYVYDQNGIF